MSVVRKRERERERERLSSSPTGIQTRSQRAASSSSRQQWTDVFLPVKIVKLLVSDLQSILESEAQPEDEDGRSSNSSEVIAQCDSTLCLGLILMCNYIMMKSVRVC